MDACKILVLAVAVIVTVVITIAVGVLRNTGETSNNAANKEYQSSLSQVEMETLNKYVNTKIYGSEVKYVLSKYSAKYKLETNKSAATSTPIKEGRSLTDFSSINDATNNFYVDQAMLFNVAGIYGTNDQLLGLSFKEVRYK